MSEVRSQLIEMGFPAGVIEAALRNTSGTIEDAIVWIEKHQNQQIAIGNSEDSNEGHISSTGEVDDAEESKQPLTEEEKKQKLELLRQRAAERKAEQSKVDAKEARRNEELMRKRDKEYLKISEEQSKQAALKEAAKRRKEALDDAAAKKRVRDQIEADKRARKAEREAALGARGESSAEQPNQEQPKQSQPKAERPVPTESKIRFRLPGSPQPLTRSYAIGATIETVLGDVARACGSTPQRVQLRLTFPTRVIDWADASLTIKDANLVNTNAIVTLT